MADIYDYKNLNRTSVSYKIMDLFEENILEYSWNKNQKTPLPIYAAIVAATDNKRKSMDFGILKVTMNTGTPEIVIHSKYSNEKNKRRSISNVYSPACWFVVLETVAPHLENDIFKQKLTELIEKTTSLLAEGNSITYLDPTDLFTNLFDRVEVGHSELRLHYNKSEILYEKNGINISLPSGLDDAKKDGMVSYTVKGFQQNRDKLIDLNSEVLPVYEHLLSIRNNLNNKFEAEKNTKLKKQNDLLQRAKDILKESELLYDEFCAEKIKNLKLVQEMDAVI